MEIDYKIIPILYSQGETIVCIEEDGLTTDLFVAHIFTKIWNNLLSLLLIISVPVYINRTYHRDRSRY